MKSIAINVIFHFRILGSIIISIYYKLFVKHAFCEYKSICAKTHITNIIYS